MSGWGFGWRVGLMAWTGLSALVGVIGLVLTQFDPQYDHDAGPGRLVSGVFAGLFALAIYAPITLAVACLAGLVAGLAHRRRLSPPST
ncbi:hypothetical protein [Aquihabitans sp. McL0605]|uniref:hypothetical protein n=1 Tax=Aquihabitans sp. McL0605 TaxID=3415671 RepID=UPI003CF3BA8B